MILVTAAGILAAFQIGKLPASIPTLRQDLELDLVFAGWIASTLHIVGLAVGIVTGALADRIGHRKVMVFSLACIAAASLAGAFAASGAEILASRVIEGVGVILVLVAGPPLVIQATAPEDRRLALGIWGSFMGVGICLMVLLTPPVLEAFGWRGVWALNALLLSTFAAGFAVATRDPTGRPAADGRLALTDLWRDVRLTTTSMGPVVLALSFAAYSAIVIAILAFLPTFLIEGNGIGLGLAAGMTALAILMNSAGNIAGGWILSRGASRWGVTAAAFAVAGLAGIGIYGDGVSVHVRYALCVVLFFATGAIPASLYSGAAALAPAPSLIATTNGLMMQGASAGQLLGPPVLALVVTLSSWGRVSWLILALAALGIVLSVVSRRAGAGASGPGPAGP